MLFDGPGGYPIEKKWWKKGIRDFKDQRDRYCRYCSIAIPMQTYPDTLKFEYVSPHVKELLEKAQFPLAKSGRLKVVKGPYTIEDIRKAKKLRPPQQYSKRGTEHFWTRNPIEFQQKIKSFPYKIMYWISSLFNR